VFIGDCNHGFLDTSKPISQQPINFAGRVEIGEGSWIGIGVAILPGVTVGKNTVIGANSVVTHDVPDCCIAAGNPARIINRIKPNFEIK
jgi:acetyltransferase-like isoleucine patch superfamily enzyme